MQISKSEYIMFLKHPAWLWLKKHDKGKLPPPDANLQAMFDEGHGFEEYAEQLFPNATRLGFNSYQEYMDLPRKTFQVLEQGAKTIFQGRFEANGTTCIVDVLDRANDGEFDLVEIKSSTQVKPEHELDLSFQVTVIEAAGIKVRNVFVIHVNNQYVRAGDIDINKLCEIADVTESVREKMEATKAGIKRAISVAESSERPDISPRYANLGGLNEWLEIYKSLVGGVDKYSIYNLASPGAKRIGELEDLGIQLVKDIPEGFKLSKKQQLQVETTKSNKQYIDKESVAEFLKKLKYPLYFLDYETFSGLIPRFDGIRPYQNVPFQYSLHILDSPQGELKHAEYLHCKNSNPGKPLIDELRSDIGDNGSVLVWLAGFEKGCNETLAGMFPEHKDFLSALNDRIEDLIIPFAKNMFVDKDFFGSASLKSVMPVLVPKLSYKELAIQEGGSASRVWMETIFENKNTDRRDKIFSDLIEYCKMDTLAMVKILARLEEEVKK
ncbi:MAG: DUF2779 domain-containing protein [Candidatus Spechtbacterales bacterium]